MDKIIGLFYLKTLNLHSEFEMNKEKKEISIPVEQIPAEGSLGLLALGDVGIRAWKEARKRKKKESEGEGRSKK
jgi:hypothetical protein